MKKAILFLAALAVSIPAYSQAVIGTPSQTNILLISVDPVQGASCPYGGLIEYNQFGGNVWLCGGPAGITLNQGVPSQSFSYSWILLSGGGKGFTPGIGPAVVSAASIQPTYTSQHVTGTTAINTIQPPPGIQSNARVLLIFDAAGSWTAAGNIKAPSTTVVAGTAYEFVWDANTSFWYPVI